MTGSGGYQTSKFRVVHVLRGTFKQYYPQTLELASVYNSGSLHVSSKWEEKRKSSSDQMWPTKKKVVSVFARFYATASFFSIMGDSQEMSRTIVSRIIDGMSCIISKHADNFIKFPSEND